jgi:hypothetical protein
MEQPSQSMAIDSLQDYSSSADTLVASECGSAAASSGRYGVAWSQVKSRAGGGLGSCGPQSQATTYNAMQSGMHRAPSKSNQRGGPRPRVCCIHSAAISSKSNRVSPLQRRRRRWNWGLDGFPFYWGLGGIYYLLTNLLTTHIEAPGEERPFLDGLGSRPALFILYYVKPNPLFQTLSTTAAASFFLPCERQISTHRDACIN